MHFNGQRWSRITRSALRGFPLNFVSKQLSLKSWFNLNTLIHIHLHSKYTNENKVDSKRVSSGFSSEKLHTMLSMLLSGVKKMEKPYQFQKHWSAYYDNDIESKYYLEHKEEVINKWLLQLKPNSVLDLGANTGKFSFISADYAKKVIAIESDDTCVDIINYKIKKDKTKVIHTILIDMVETTSNIGVLNKEFKSIYTRANSELVLGLAIIHHLFISNQLNFSLITEMFSMLSSRYLVLEFIPKTDSKVQLLLKDKNIDMTNYEEEEFLNELSKCFELKDIVLLKDSSRRLFLLEKNVK
jgi:hypothetical protein